MNRTRMKTTKMTRTMKTKMKTKRRKRRTTGSPHNTTVAIAAAAEVPCGAVQVGLGAGRALLRATMRTTALIMIFSALQIIQGFLLYRKMFLLVLC